MISSVQNETTRVSYFLAFFLLSGQVYCISRTRQFFEHLTVGLMGYSLAYYLTMW